MDTGRGSDPNRPVEPDEARAHGNDPDAVEVRNGGAEDGPRRVGELHEEREGAGTQGATQGEERLEGHGAGDAQAGWNIPSRNLPPLGNQDLPEPIPLRRLIGASVVLLATALGSGELIIWPYITTQVGIGLLWFAAFGFSLQYFLNMEIERYTLATGETAVTGFTRYWKPWGVIFVLGALLPNAWPGWATGGATMLTFLGIGGEGSISLIATIALIATALALTLSPVVYQALEKIQMVLVSVILVFLLVAIFAATELSAWGEIVTRAPAGALNLPNYMAQLGAATILGAIAFAGAGGANNLTQSNYIRDKGLGMGSRMPKVVSPITGQEEARASLGYTFPVNEENMRRWRGWWKVANQEQVITFYIIGLLTLISLSVLVYSTVGQGNVGEAADPTFLQEEGQILGERIAPWFEVFFYFAGAVVLFSTSIGIADYVSRLSASELKISFFRESETVTESRIYFTFVWLIAILGSLVLLAGFDQPIVLLIIAASGGGVVMFFYSGMLIWLNTRALPDPIKLRGWRLVGMAIAFLTFAVLSMYLLGYYLWAGVTGNL